MSWLWRIARESNRPVVGRNTYILVPGEDSGYLKAQPGGDPREVREVQLFVSAAPDSEGGFIIHKAAVAE